MIWGDILKANHNDNLINNDEMVDICGNKENIEEVYENPDSKEYADNKGKKISEQVQDKSDNSPDDAADTLVDINQSSAGRGKRFKPANGGSSDNLKKNKKKIVIITSAIAVAVLAVVSVAGFVIYNLAFSPSSDNSKETNYVFRFAEGTVVSGVSIGNKTVEQAKEILEENKDKFLKPLSISINANGEVIQFNEKDFEYTYDIDEVLRTIKSDESYTADKSDKKASASENIGTTGTSSYVITATVTEDSIDNKVKEVEETINKDAVNAHVSEFKPYAEKRFTYAEAESGYKIDSEDLTDKITGFFDSDASEIRIEAEGESIEADIQIDDVKSNIVQLAKYETVSYNTANGTNNMEVSLKACNGSIIEPDEVWSFNKCTGDSNLEENGYLPAHVISDGKLVDGIGGGLCQSSSTIYNAAIRANMDIEERSNHKWASTYVPTGLDATIDYPGLDLKLKNPTDYQMFIECKVYDGNVLTVSIWGYKPPNYDEIVTENKMLDKGKSSYSVEAFRVYIKDGKEIDRESLGKSTYDLDSDHGVVFYDAENDSRAKSVNSSSEEKPKKQESSNTESENSQSSAQRQESSQSSQEKPKPQPSTQHQESSTQSSEEETQPPTQSQSHESDPDENEEE